MAAWCSGRGAWRHKFSSIKECLCDWVIFYSLQKSIPCRRVGMKKSWKTCFDFFTSSLSILQFNSDFHLFDNSRMNSKKRSLSSKLSIKYFSITCSILNSTSYSSHVFEINNKAWINIPRVSMMPKRDILLDRHIYTTSCSNGRIKRITFTFKYSNQRKCLTSNIVHSHF